MSSNPDLNTASPLMRVLSGKYGLALTYWVLYLTGAVIFFVVASIAVADEAWTVYVTLLGLMLVWTFVLLTGIKFAYQGEDPGKALGRIAMLFLLLNLTNALAALSFI
jgi:hypothetical protein